VTDPSDAAAVVAFYLPQYHQIPENDQWWGEGFTDWTNVRRAKPLFEGHDQPRVPTTLGYYDLLDLDVHHHQGALARSYGVSAFCYYAYWFGGRRLLERPLQLVGENPDLGMPYAICWANEPWSRRWDGSEHEVLMEQNHAPDRDSDFIDAIAEHLADTRYLRVNGKPLLLVYRAGLLVDPLRTTDLMRERALNLGLGELFLAMMQTFGAWEPLGYGFDAAVEFPPHGITPSTIAATLRKAPPPGNRSISNGAEFRDAILVSLSRPVPAFPWYRTVMTGWDNTPRRGVHGTVYIDASPDLFRRWLEEALHCTYLFRPPGERLVFVNAWNEWAEGTYLEPDVSHGTAYLEAVQGALAATADFARETGELMRTAVGATSLIDYARRRWSDGL
jgi:O-antigen biosynthesis protein